MVLISEADVRAMREAFAAGHEAVVTAHRLVPEALTSQQRERRKAYRQRPEVREKQKAYRALRATRLRAAAMPVATVPVTLAKPEPTTAAKPAAAKQKP
jgi:hypothetical protein